MIINMTIQGLYADTTGLVPGDSLLVLIDRLRKIDETARLSFITHDDVEILCLAEHETAIRDELDTIEREKDEAEFGPMKPPKDERPSVTQLIWAFKDPRRRAAYREERRAFVERMRSGR